MKFICIYILAFSQIIFADDRQEQVLDFAQAGQMISHIDDFIVGPNFQSSSQSCPTDTNSSGVQIQACAVPTQSKSKLSQSEVFIKKVKGSDPEFQKIAKSLNLEFEEDGIYYAGLGLGNDGNMMFLRPMKVEGDDFAQTHEMTFEFGELKSNGISWRIDGGTRAVTKMIEPGKTYSKDREELSFDTYTYQGQNGEVYERISPAKVQTPSSSKTTSSGGGVRLVRIMEAQYKGPDGKVYGESELQRMEGLSYGAVYKDSNGKKYTNDQLMDIPELENGATLQQFATQEDYINLMFDNKEMDETFYWKAGVGLVAYRTDNFGKLGAQNQQKVTHKLLDDDDYGVPQTIGDGQDSKYGFRVHLGGGVQDKFLENEFSLFGSTIKCNVEVDAEVATQLGSLEGDNTISLSTGARLNLNLPNNYRASLGVKEKGTKYGILDGNDGEDLYHTRTYRFTVSSPRWDVSVFKTAPQSGYENPPMFAPLINETTEEDVWGIETRYYFSDRKLN